MNMADGRNPAKQNDPLHERLEHYLASIPGELHPGPEPQHDEPTIGPTAGVMIIIGFTGWSCFLIGLALGLWSAH